AGGTVLRRPVMDVVQDFLNQDSAAIDREIATLEAEYKQATGEAKASVRAQLEAAEAKRQQVEDRTKARDDGIQIESQAKIETRKAQAATARADRKQKIERRVAELEVENAVRQAKLDKANVLQTEAWKLKREALFN